MGFFNGKIKVEDLEQALRLAGLPNLSGVIQKGLNSIEADDDRGVDLQERGKKKIADAEAVFARETAVAAKKRDEQVAVGSMDLNEGNVVRKQAAANRKTMTPLLRYVKSKK
jgi:hypothetical protein